MPHADEAARRAYHKEYNARWREKNREKLNEKAREYQSANREACAARSRRWAEADRARSRAVVRKSASKLSGYFNTLLHQQRRQGHTLTREFLVNLWEAQGGLCALTGIPMTHAPGRDKPFNVSLDRIVAGGAYSPDNVQLTCKFANIMRTNLSVSEAKAMLRNTALAIISHLPPE